MENVLQIFEVVAEQEDLRIGNLEKRIGASKGVLSRAIKNGSDIQSKWLLALIENFPNYDYASMLRGEFSPNKDLVQYKNDLTRDSAGEEGLTYNKEVTLSSLRNEIRGDLKVILEGLTSNFETISEGVYRGLRDNQKILKFIEGLDEAGIKNASRGLNKFLEEHQ